MNNGNVPLSDEIAHLLEVANIWPLPIRTFRSDMFERFLELAFPDIQPNIPNFRTTYYEPSGAMFIPLSAVDRYSTDTYILMLGRYLWHLRHFQTRWQLPASLTIILDCFHIADEEYYPKPLSFIIHATRGTTPAEVVLYLALPREHISIMGELQINGTPNYWIHAPFQGDIFTRYLAACQQFSTKISYTIVQDDFDCEYTDDLFDIDHVRL